MAERAVNVLSSSNGFAKKKKKPSTIHIDFTTMSESDLEETDEIQPLAVNRKRRLALRRTAKKKRHIEYECKNFSPGAEAQVSYDDRCKENMRRSSPLQAASLTKSLYDIECKANSPYLEVNESENDSSEGEDAGLVFKEQPRVIIDEHGAILDDYKSQEVEDDVLDTDLFKVDPFIVEESDEEKVDLAWERKYLGTLRVEFKTEKDLNKMPNYFRSCRSLRDGLTACFTMVGDSEYELVMEILRAEQHGVLDVWIMRLGSEKKRKVSLYRDFSDEESDKEDTIVTVNLLIYIKKTAAARELNLNRTFAKFGSAELLEMITQSEQLQNL